MEAMEDIKVFPPQDGRWKVEFFILFENMSDENLAEILKEAKKRISRRYKTPLGLLSYKDLVHKEIKADGFLVTAQIVLDEAERGEPVLRILNASNAGIEYPEMILYIDIYPKKLSGDLVDISDVENLLHKAKINKDKINLNSLQKAIDTTLKDMTPLKNVLLAQGHFPDPSEDANVELLFSNRIHSDNTYIGTSKVEVNQTLCHKTPLSIGQKPGFNIRNNPLLPSEPLDIEIIAGNGAKLSQLGNEIIALERGIPRINESKTPDKHILKRLVFSLEEVEVQDGSQVLSITSDKHIEVVGGLKAGSNIISQGEVIIDGDVEKDTSIVATGGINIFGKVNGGTLLSENDILSEGDVESAKLTAQGRLTIKGIAKNSELVGYEVHAEKVVGCKITAGKSAMIDYISKDEKGFSALITVGLADHLQERYKENETFIKFAQDNLNRYRTVVGNEIVDTATSANISRMVIIYCRDLRQKGIVQISKEHLDAMKGLFSTIGPIRELMQDKIKTNFMLMAQIKRGASNPTEITFKRAVEFPVEVNINGVKGEVRPEDSAVMLSNEEGIITKKPLLMVNSIDDPHNTTISGD